MNEGKKKIMSLSNGQTGDWGSKKVPHSLRYQIQIDLTVNVSPAKYIFSSYLNDHFGHESVDLIKLKKIYISSPNRPTLKVKWKVQKPYPNQSFLIMIVQKKCLHTTRPNWHVSKEIFENDFTFLIDSTAKYLQKKPLSSTPLMRPQSRSVHDII